jgi:glucosamine-6-phosphate deaminase
MTSENGADFPHGLASFLAFQDAEACSRVRKIKRSEIAQHENKDFHISTIAAPGDFYEAMARDLVERIRASRDEGRQLVLILPCGPVPNYRIAAAMINGEKLSMQHVHTYNMDEYANEDGATAPGSWPGSFQYTMRREFFGPLDPELRPLDQHVHFPSSANISGYSDEIAAEGGADVCYGGIGWSGHIAFWEPHLAREFEGDWDAWCHAGARLVELHPMTVMQNALHSFGGDWSWVPPQAVTIGPRDIVGAHMRSFWLDGDLSGGVSWQRFIARLVAHGPVTPFVPGSVLQTLRTDFTILGNVADDVEIHMG